ncbi:MAG: hypothetical protein H7Y88_12850 [Phycisphaerales bacterium]|nr:hypothetical protein [Phycisphaerales bacterium]
MSADAGEQGKQDGAGGAEGAPAVLAEAVTLVKGRHRWTFVCGKGDEQRLLTYVAGLAGREGVPFDLFDAALVSHQITGRLHSGLNRVDEGEGTAH